MISTDNNNTLRPDVRKTNPSSPDPAQHFTVPEGYYDELKAKVLDRIHSEEVAHTADSTAPAPEEEKRPLHVILRPYLYLAAMFVGMALFFKVLPLITRETPAPDTTSAKVLTEEELKQQALSEEEFRQYILEDTEDEYLFATVFE